MSSESDTITILLERIREGSPEAKDKLIALLYERFRERAHRRLRHERVGHSLSPTDLTNEALVRLLKYDEFAKAANANQLFRAFARAMRQVLIDHARRHKAAKHGGDRQREELNDLVEDVRHRSRFDVLSLDEALDALAAEDARAAEVLEMQYFGGYEMAEIAEALEVSLSTVEKASRYGRAFFRDYLSPEDAS